MRKLMIITATVTLFAIAACQTKKQNTMKINAGIVTQKLAESKAFYTNILGFSVKFENEFYLLLESPKNGGEISFLKPNHPSQQAIFHQEFNGRGVYLTIEVKDVDKIYKNLKLKNLTIAVDLRDEPWGDRHFAITDPNGINIDIVKYSPQ